MINDIWHLFKYLLAFWRWSIGKESSCRCRRHNSIPGLRRSPRIGNGNPFHGLWSQTWLSTHRCTIGLLCVFFGERSIQILCPFFKMSFYFFFFLLSFRSSLYILDINPLSHIWFANTFFNFLACLFILLIISFAIQMLFSWCNPIFKFLLLMLLALYPRNHCQSQSKEAFSLCFLHGVSLFQVLHLRLTLFEFIFVCVIRVQINYFASRYPFYPTLFWRDCYFTICM